MAVLLLPIDSSSEDYTVDIELEGVTYTFRVYWQNRRAAWFIDLSRGTTTIVTGLRLAAGNVPLLGVPGGSSRPPGELYVFDTGGNDVDPGRNDLGDESRVRVTYRESV